MHLSRRNPRLRSFKNVVVATFAIFILTNFADSSFTRVFAPVSAEAAAVAVENYIPADIPTSGDRDLDLVILRAGEQYGVDPRLVHAVIWQESKYKNEAVSHVGAQGLMQLMPATAKRFGCEDSGDSGSNVNAGVKYLRFLLKRFDGDVTLALAGYNAGEGNVDKYEGVPPFGETQNYVRIITGRYGKTYHPILAPEEATSYFKLLPTQAHELAAR
jgi:soluble lytic murein transglycosylase-like protein